MRAGIFAMHSTAWRVLTHDRLCADRHVGCGGRSFSLGIADPATVLAATAAAADAAATLIANAGGIHHPSIQRRPARELDPIATCGICR